MKKNIKKLLIAGYVGVSFLMVTAVDALPLWGTGVIFVNLIGSLLLTRTVKDWRG